MEQATIIYIGPIMIYNNERHTHNLGMVQRRETRSQVRVDRTLCCHPFFFFFFFNMDFFSYKQHFATFYVSLYDIYTINTIKQ
jgi:hypothetical protein